MRILDDVKDLRKSLLQAIKDNRKEELCLYKLVIFGPSRVGKSSLFQILLNKTPAKNSESTGVYKFKMFKVAITKSATDSRFLWREVDIENEIAWLRCLLGEHKDDFKQDKQPNLLSSDPEDLSQADSLDAVKILCENDESVEEFTTLMACYDSGGQPEFFDVMPLLATNPTGYIMVLDMHVNNDKPAESKARVKGEECTSSCKVTSINMMKNAIASIQSCREYASRNNLLVVGTYLDKCDNPNKQITELDGLVQRQLMHNKAESLFRKCQKGTNAQTVNAAYIHPVANFIESETTDNINIKQITEDSIHQIYTAVEDMSSINKLREKISVKLLLFLFELQLKLTVPPFYLTKSKYSEYAERCQIDQQNVNEALEHFHKLGFLFFFKGVKDVVFSPQWVFNRLSDIIFKKYKPDDLQQKKDFIIGQMTKDAFGTFFSDEINDKGEAHKINKDGIAYLYEIFTSQKIMVEMPEEDLYFMPALLDPGSPDDKSLLDNIQRMYGKKIYKRLYVKFENHYFPRVLFCYLTIELIKKGWKIQDMPRCNNILVFEISCDQYVGLFDYSTKLAIDVYVKPDKSKDLKPHEITDSLYRFITEGCNKIEVSCNFKFGFTCMKFDNCEKFAGVELKYPYSAKKCCEDGKHTTILNSDELIWLTSPDIIDIMVCNHGIIRSIYVAQLCMHACIL